MVEAITEQPGTACASCHATLLNPIGFATENIDALGRLRSTQTLYDEAGKVTGTVPVDTRARPQVVHGDLEEVSGVAGLARKIVEMRIFDDAQGVMNRSLLDVSGDVLAVSQFTLYASTRKGNRPSWSRAAPPEIAAPQFDAFVEAVAARIGKPVATGQFGANMQVALVNDGPVTIWLDSRNRE